MIDKLKKYINGEGVISISDINEITKLLEQGQMFHDELKNIAEQVGETEDLFSAWESIDLIKRQLAIYQNAVQQVINCTGGSHAVSICHKANSSARAYLI